MLVRYDLRGLLQYQNFHLCISLLSRTWKITKTLIEESFSLPVAGLLNTPRIHSCKSTAMTFSFKILIVFPASGLTVSLFAPS